MTFQFEKVFVPSASLKDADWFIMDSEGKKRVMNPGREAEERQDADTTEVPTTEESVASTDVFDAQTEPTNDAAFERQTEGGFQPVHSPDTLRGIIMI